jgi:hypothetical protein
MARERILEVHAAHALELIGRARGQVPTMRALEIYLRLHQLAGHEAEILSTRVLARLGAQGEGRPRLTGAGRAAENAAAEDEWDSPRSWVRRLRARLRGRTLLELRRWVELHTGRTEAALLRAHVEGAIRIIDIVKPTHAFAEAVELYTSGMAVPPSLSRAVYFLALDQIAGGELARRTDPPLPTEQPSGRRSAQQPLRVLKT